MNRQRKVLITITYNEMGTIIDTKAEEVTQPVEPKRPEIIRCKNCRHNNNCEIQYAAQAGSGFFCGLAKRKGEK